MLSEWKSGRMSSMRNRVFMSLVHLVLLIGFILGLYAMVLWFNLDMSSTLGGAIMATIALMVGKIGTVIDYCYGSSEGSRIKTEALLKGKGNEE